MNQGPRDFTVNVAGTIQKSRLLYLYSWSSCCGRSFAIDAGGECVAIFPYSTKRLDDGRSRELSPEVD